MALQQSIKKTDTVERDGVKTYYTEEFTFEIIEFKIVLVKFRHTSKTGRKETVLKCWWRPNFLHPRDQAQMKDPPEIPEHIIREIYYKYINMLSVRQELTDRTIDYELCIVDPWFTTPRGLQIVKFEREK